LMKIKNIGNVDFLHQALSADITSFLWLKERSRASPVQFSQFLVEEHELTSPEKSGSNTEDPPFTIDSRFNNYFRAAAVTDFWIGFQDRLICLLNVR
jgi:hypothetical protein